MNSRDGRQHLFYCCAVLAAIALSANLASAQTNLGNISGAVNDPQGAALPDADVTATAVATGVTTKTKTNETGFYVLPNLPIGSYVLTVERSGYSRYVREGITMTTGQSISVDVKLQIGAVAETVTVTGAASVLGTRTSDVSQLVESQSVQDIPLGDRRVLNIISLAAGALFVRYNANARANFVLAGGRAQSQMFWVDGGSGVNMRIGVAQIDVDPPVDYVREVKVIANAAAAEYGGSAGGVVVVSTKSGTNQFHGTLSEFLRNDKLDAPGFFAPVVNGRKDRPSLRYNVFGGTLGGPVRRDKSFFFLGYEGSFRRTGDTETLTVPSIPQREGDFSQTFTAAGQLVPIYDPGSTVTQGARTVRTPFANNRIPANQLDPVAVKLMPFYPLPNRTPDNLAGANNVRANYVFALDRRNIMGKLDHNFSAKDRLVARYNYNNDVNRYTSVYPDPGADGRQHSVRRYQYWYGSWTRVASASLVNDLRFTYGNRMIDYSTKGQGGSYPEKLGLKGVHDDGFPQFSPAGFSSVGASQADRDQFPSEQFQFVNDVSWVHGRHFVKFGGEARRSSNVEANYGESTGFSPQGTGLPGAAASGSGLASLLTGFVTSFNQSTQPALNRNAWYLAGFVQDDWGIRKNLTLNLGLRWETDTPVVDAANRMNGFDPTAINPVSGTPGVVKFAGLNGFPSKPYRTDWNNFGPRIGFAWRPLGSPTTAVRGFFGIFFAHPFDTGVPTAASLGFNVSTSMNSPDNGITPAFFLRNGAPVSPAAPVLNDSFGSVPVGAAPRVAVTYFDPARRTGYSQQFNLTNASYRHAREG